MINSSTIMIPFSIQRQQARYSVLKNCTSIRCLPYDGLPIVKQSNPSVPKTKVLHTLDREDFVFVFICVEDERLCCELGRGFHEHFTCSQMPIMPCFHHFCGYLLPFFNCRLKIISPINFINACDMLISLGCNQAMASLCSQLVFHDFLAPISQELMPTFAFTLPFPFDLVLFEMLGAKLFIQTRSRWNTPPFLQYPHQFQAMSSKHHCTTINVMSLLRWV